MLRFGDLESETDMRSTHGKLSVAKRCNLPKILRLGAYISSRLQVLAVMSLPLSLNIGRIFFIRTHSTDQVQIFN